MTKVMKDALPGDGEVIVVQVRAGRREAEHERHIVAEVAAEYKFECE